MNVTIKAEPGRGLVLEIPEIHQALESMDLVSKQELACYLACDEEIFTKITDILADGFCHINEDDWRWWYPGGASEARAKFDARLEGVAAQRVEDLKLKVQLLTADLAHRREWEDAYHEALSQAYGGDDSRAHTAALRCLDAARAQRESPPMCSPTQDPATGQWECPRGKDYPWESLDEACERCGEGEG